MLKRVRRSLIAIGLVGAVACGGSAGLPADATPPSPPPSISVSAGSPTVSVRVGATATVSVTVTRAGGYAGSVSLSADGVPSGVAVSFAPASLSSGETTSTLSLAVAANAAIGSSTVVVRASGSGVASQSVAVVVTVEPPSQGITLVVDQPTITAVGGSTVTADVSITRVGGYTGAVSLSADGLPSGVSASFAPTSLSSGQSRSVVTLSVGPTAATTTSNITIRASGPEAASQSVSLTLTIVAGAPRIVVTTDTAFLDVLRGTTATVRVTVVRLGGYVGAVNLSAQGGSGDVTTSFLPASIPSGATSSILTLTVSPTALADQRRGLVVTVQASGSGVSATAATVTVNVFAVPFAIGTVITGRSVDVARGTSATVPLLLTRTVGFSAPVSLTVEGLPSGVTASITPSVLDGSVLTSALLIVVPANGPQTSNLITIRATASGIPVQTAQFTLDVIIPPGIAITANSSSVVLPRGATSTVGLTIARLGGYNDVVSLSAEGVPSGVTVTFAPATLLSAGPSTVSFTAAANASLGTNTITIRASGTGVTSQAVPIALTVADAAPGIAVTVVGAATAAGTTATSAVSITRSGGFAGAVALSLTGLPTGITHAFNPATVTATSSVLSLTVAPTVPAGDYFATVSATATGVPVSTATLRLTVTSSGAGRIVAFPFCGAEPIPSFFAYRDGEGAWTRVTPAGGIFRFTLTQNVGAVAYATSVVNVQNEMTVLYYTAEQFARIAVNRCPTSTTTKSVTGTLEITSIAQLGTVTIGTASAVNLGRGSFTVAGVPDGVVDVLASSGVRDFPLFAILGGLARVAIRRGINPPNNGSIGPLIDLRGPLSGPGDGVESFSPVSVEYSIQDAVGHEITASATFTSANGSSLSFVSGDQAPIRLYGFPSTRTQVGDLHAVHLAAKTPTIGGAYSARGIVQFSRDLTARSVSLGAGLNTPTVTRIGNAPYPRLRAQGTWQPEFNDVMEAIFEQQAVAPRRRWRVNVSRQYVGSSSSTYDIAIPDLSAVAGLPANFGLSPVAPVQATVTGHNGFVGLSTFADGTTFKNASSSRTIPP